MGAPYLYVGQSSQFACELVDGGGHLQGSSGPFLDFGKEGGGSHPFAAGLVGTWSEVFEEEFEEIGALLEAEVMAHQLFRLGSIEPVAGVVVQFRLRLGKELRVVGGLVRIDVAGYIDATPTDFINGYRLRHAAHLLATTTDSVSLIAELCGLSRPTFYRLFSETYGMSPSDYRRVAKK